MLLIRTRVEKRHLMWIAKKGFFQKMMPKMIYKKSIGINWTKGIRGSQAEGKRGKMEYKIRAQRCILRVKIIRLRYQKGSCITVNMFFKPLRYMIPYILFPFSFTLFLNLITFRASTNVGSELLLIVLILDDFR